MPGADGRGAGVAPDLTGRVVLVTGAARGQGRSHCLAMAAAGADVAALDICADLDVPSYALGARAELDETVDGIEGFDRRAVPLVADVRAPDEVAAARAPSAAGGSCSRAREVDDLVALLVALGRIDIVVNNAAVVTSAPSGN